MNRTRLAQLFRHLLRDVLNETDEELGQPFDEIAAFMADYCLVAAYELSEQAADDHKFDAAIRSARDEVKRFAGLNGSHPDHRHILGAIQGAFAIGIRVVRA